MKHVVLAAIFLLAACEEYPPPEEATELPRTVAPAGASVYIISPADSDTLAAGEVTVRFGLVGMGVAPAGVDFVETGHHHLLLNVETLPPMDLPLPNDANHLHFGNGQTETTLELPSGTHTLQLLLGDRLHIPHDPPVISEKITVTVE